MMVSSLEGSTRRPGTIAHDPEAAIAQSVARSRVWVQRPRSRRTLVQSSDEAESAKLVAQDRHRGGGGTDGEVPEPDL